MAVFVAELRTVDNSVDKLRFDLNPNSLRRTRHPQYADVNAALADWTGNYPTNAPSPLEWLRNPPEEISVECLFHRDKGSVDDALEKLVKDGKVTHLNNEGPGKFEVSDADTLLAQAKAA